MGGYGSGPSLLDEDGNGENFCERLVNTHSIPPGMIMDEAVSDYIGQGKGYPSEREIWH